MGWFEDIDPVLQALLASLLAWTGVAVGAALVFLFKELNRKIFDALLGFAAGVTAAAAFWSLLDPAVGAGGSVGIAAWVPAVIGLVGGSGVFFVADKLVPHVHIGQPRDAAEGIASTWKRSVLVVLAVTLHHLPAALAIGILFAGAASGIATRGAAIAFAVAISVRNVPEGLGIAIPLRREGMRSGRAFWYGQSAGFVAPVAAVLGAIVIVLFPDITPYALAFAAGGMLFLVVEQMIPESQLGGNVDVAGAGAVIGFGAMMVLNTALR